MRQAFVDVTLKQQLSSTNYEHFVMDYAALRECEFQTELLVSRTLQCRIISLYFGW